MKYLVVGAGLSGIIISRLLTNLGHQCFIIDERSHIGGNCYTTYHNSSYIHVYGPHVIHTSNKQIWDFINKYEEFLPYQVNIKSKSKDGKLYSLPFNMNTFYEIFKTSNIKDIIEILENEIKDNYHENPQNLEEQAINLVGPTIYNLLIKEYTEKQWNDDCKNLDPNIIKRLPVRLSWNNNYYNDTYQGIPKYGYTMWMMNILNGLDWEDMIEYQLNTEFNFNNLDEYLMKYDKIIYTGQVDKLFNYKFGELGWRSLRFDHQELLNTVENDQGTAVINYPDKNIPYTRSVDHYYFNHIVNDYQTKTKILTYEYPDDYTQGKIAYYPINNQKNQDIYNKYVEYIKEKYPKIILLGRLAEYKYFDMDDIIEKCFKFVGK